MRSKARRFAKSKFRVRRPSPEGVSPGSLVADPNAPRPKVTVFAYGPTQVIEEEIFNVSDVSKFLGKWPVTWVNVDGLGDTEAIQEIGRLFDIHRLILEDLINVPQRPKTVTFDEHLFVIARMVNLREQLDTEQISFILGGNFLLTFQERPGDCFDMVRARLRKAEGKVRNSGPDYLLYALMDAIVDDFFPLLESFSEHLVSLEDQVLTNPDREVIGRIHEIRREFLIIRRAIWPKREAVNAMMRESVPHITSETRVYMRDCYDHVIQVIDLLENYRELASGLMEAYLSSLSNRMNEIMKTLTMFSTIFIPLTFIVGLYGMNFNTQASPWNMPELNWVYGYPAALCIMLFTIIFMLFYFRRKSWIGYKNPPTNGNDVRSSSDSTSPKQNGW